MYLYITSGASLNTLTFINDHFHSIFNLQHLRNRSALVVEEGHSHQLWLINWLLPLVVEVWDVVDL